MVTRHEFLAQLHAQLQPRGYLEIGVLFGDSLHLAKCPAIGIDPEPHLRYHQPSSLIYRGTSDEFFAANEPEWIQDRISYIDLAFIDGMHLFEFALRDFQNVERYSNPRTVIVFDDVLPRNQEEAAREQCPGDWTGDVWKVHVALTRLRPDLNIHLVNTDPTGTMVVWGLDNEHRWDQKLLRAMEHDSLNKTVPVPDDVLQRRHAVTPEWALEQVALYLKGLDA